MQVPKDRNAFIVTPIFQHGQINTNANKKGTNTTTYQQDSFNDHIDEEYNRKVIDRIITPIPFNNGLDFQSNDSGEIEVCMEEYYPKTHSFRPLFRRVAIRSYIGDVMNCCGDDMTHDDKHAHKKENNNQNQNNAMERDEDDTSVTHKRNKERNAKRSKSRCEVTPEKMFRNALQASFSLPVGELPRNVVSEMLLQQQQKQQQQQEHHHNDQKILIPSVSNNWMCWTKFCNQSKQHVHTATTNEEDDNAKRVYLCILTGPRTLKIFDVYPNCSMTPSSSSSPFKTRKDDHDKNVNDQNNIFNDGISQGDGQTISLPFEASSIFALPNPYYGLLIQRADNAEEVEIMSHLTTTMANTHDDLNNDYGGDDYYFHSDYVRESNGKSDEDAPINSNNNSNSKDEDEFVMGPPSTVRLTSNTNNNTNFTNEENNSDAMPYLNLGIDAPQIQQQQQHQQQQHYQQSNNVGADLPPSLYTLHHPLDDVLPCNISSTSIMSNRQHDNVENYDNQIDDDNGLPEIGTKGKHFTLNTTGNRQAPSMISHFTNIFEQVIYIGKPRYFIPFDNSFDDNFTDNALIIVVTYNTQRKRHAVWTIDDAINPSKKLELWQETNLALKNDKGIYDFDLIHNLNAKDSEMDVLMTDSRKEEEFQSNNDIMSHVFSSFSEIHARISLKCIYRTNAGSDDEIENVASNIFLATNAHDNGDFVLCLLQQKLAHKDLMSGENDHTLHCFILSPGWSIHHKYEIDCCAAQPVMSTPINPPSFLPTFFNEMGQRNFFAQWRTKYDAEPPMAADICICSRIGNQSQISLYRESILIADCKILSPKCSLNGEDKSINTFGLQNPVGERFDVILKNENRRPHVSLRVALSMVVKSSPVTETSLLAMASCLVSENQWDVEDENDLSCALTFAFRSDCANISQLISGLPEAQELLDDVHWFVFTSLISVFFGFALNEASTRNYLSSLESESKESFGDTTPDGDNYWQTLLQSEFHRQYHNLNFSSFVLSNQDESLEANGQAPLNKKFFELFLRSSCYLWLSTYTSSNVRKNICTSIFDSLHLLYEELKLSKSHSTKNQVGNLLHNLSKRSIFENNSNMSDFVQVYERDMGINISDLQLPCCEVFFEERVTSYNQPPCFFKSLERILYGEDISNIFNKFTNDNNTMSEMKTTGVCTTLGSLLHFFGIYFDKKWNITDKRDLVERDRCLVNAMTMEGFHCTSKLLDRFPLSIVSLLMQVCHNCRLNPPPISSDWSTSAYQLVGRSDLKHLKIMLSPTEDKAFVAGRNSSLVSKAFVENDVDKDGLVSIEKYSSMYFPNDTRVREAAKLLQSSRPTFLRVQRPVEVTDHDYETLKKEKLALLCRRVVSLPLGRGMITYSTLDPVPAEPLTIPKLCLAGRMPPRNATLALDDTMWSAESNIWPDFHNGVAAGLRLPMAIDTKFKSLGDIERSWIVYSKTQDTQGTSQNNNNADNEIPSAYAHGGFLMALGLRGYLSSLSMPDVIDYLTKGSVTTAVGILLGMSANKKGTCDLSVSKMLCLHIPSLFPASFSSIDVESETQTAAVAGIGLLYQNSSHRLMTEFLLNELGKRPTNEHNINDRESYALCCGISLGMVNSGLRKTSLNKTMDDLSDLRLEERLLRYITGGLDESHVFKQKKRSQFNSNSSASESERSSRIFEGDMINTDITAPGATLALGLIYLKSGNQSIAKKLALPETSFAMDKVRPDLLFLLVVARSLILWDGVEGSPTWIEEQLPSFVREFIGHIRRKLSGESKYEKFNHNYDSKAMKEAYAYITAGSCFSLGLRFAGSGHKLARDAIFEKVVEFQKYRDDNDPSSILLRPQRQVVDMCIGSLAISLSLVMAGTGNLKTLRILKILRWKCDDSVKYGCHMAINAAIGMLFLGGGTCTVGQEPEDISSLLLAFYPRFPMSEKDNQYHLQALRHMYAIGVKQRKIEAIDVDSREKIFVPIKIQYTDSTSIETKAPCLILNYDKLQTIRVESDRYYPVEIDIKASSITATSLNLFVKKRSGCISHVEDPHGSRSNFFQSVASHSDKSLLDLLAFTTDAKDLRLYAQYVCGNNDVKSNKTLSYLSSFESFCGYALRESLLEEKTEVVPLLLGLYEAMTSIERKSYQVNTTIWDLRLLRSMYQSVGRSNNENLQIISPSLVATICQYVDRSFYSTDKQDCGAYSIWSTGIGDV